MSDETSREAADSLTLDREVEQYRQLSDHPASGREPAAPSSREIALLADNYSQPASQNITRTELLAGMTALAVWLVVFSSGLFVPTDALRSAIASPQTNGLLKVWYGVVVGFSYTLTNVLFLSCLTAFLGCMMRRWQVGDSLGTTAASPPPVGATRIYLAAVLRGFFLYLTFISGFLLVSTEKTVTETEFAQYIRIAGMTSIIGFIVGYDPNLLIRLMHRILSLANVPLEKAVEQRSGVAAGDAITAPTLDRPLQPR